MIMLGASLTIGIILIATVSFFFKESIYEQNIEIAKAVLTSVENEIFLATRVEAGYIRNFEIPERLNNEDYNISIDDGDIVLSYKNIDFFGVLPNISGDIRKGVNTVRNVNGKVCLNIQTC